MPREERSTDGGTKPATKEWVEAKLETVEKTTDGLDSDIKEVKEIALSGKKTAEKPHQCSKEDELKTIRKDVDSWTRWWRGTMITVISAIVIGVTVMGGWLYSHKLQAEKIESLDTNVQKVKENVKDLGSTQKRIESEMKKKNLRDDAQEEQRLVRMKRMLKGVIEEVEDERKPRRRSRGQ